MNGQGKQLSAKAAKKAHVAAFFVGLLGMFTLFDSSDAQAACDSADLNFHRLYEGLELCGNSGQCFIHQYQIERIRIQNNSIESKLRVER
jgi:hypothetical protein